MMCDLMIGLDPGRVTAMLEALCSAEAELSLPSLIVLLAVAEEPGISVNDVADRAGLPQQTASRHVAMLQGRYQSLSGTNPWVLKPLLSQEINVADPRRRALFLTSNGTSTLEGILSKMYAQ